MRVLITRAYLVFTNYAFGHITHIGTVKDAIPRRPETAIFLASSVVRRWQKKN
jgi:hypothetical protein